jgi:hypothetical protein
MLLQPYAALKQATIQLHSYPAAAEFMQHKTTRTLPDSYANICPTASIKSGTLLLYF